MTQNEFEDKYSKYICWYSEAEGVSYNSALERLYELHETEGEVEWAGWLDYIVKEYQLNMAR